jgi:hypothetical protein
MDSKVDKVIDIFSNSARGFEFALGRLSVIYNLPG